MTSSASGGSNTSFSDISNEQGGLARYQKFTKIPACVDPAVKQYQVLKFSNAEQQIKKKLKPQKSKSPVIPDK